MSAPRAYYNEIDPFAAAWLRELIRGGHIAAGDVDERSIADVQPGDIDGYTQCHFFAGIGVWSAALRGAGWPDDRPVWTGSCPCQPFSSAGAQAGFDDKRHLWPHLAHLIRECRPSVVFGEQVASPLGRAWLDVVLADLEAMDYAGGAVDICAASIGAPHIRQRLYWVADADGGERNGLTVSERCVSDRASAEWPKGDGQSKRGRASGGMAHTDGGNSSAEREQCGGQQRLFAIDGGADGLADTAQRGRREECENAGRFGARDRAEGITARLVASGGNLRPSPTNGSWRNADWLLCTDGKWRPVEPGTFPLAHGSPARVGRLRGYGNSIVLSLAVEFIKAYREARAQ